MMQQPLGAWGVNSGFEPVELVEPAVRGVSPGREPKTDFGDWWTALNSEVTGDFVPSAIRMETTLSTRESAPGRTRSIRPTTPLTRVRSFGPATMQRLAFVDHVLDDSIPCTGHQGVTK